jgi:hypothetical protein
MSAMEAASLEGLGSLAAFWYAELPTTKATRFSALAAKLVANNNTTLRNSADIHRLIGQAPASSETRTDYANATTGGRAATFSRDKTLNVTTISREESS